MRNGNLDPCLIGLTTNYFIFFLFVMSHVGKRISWWDSQRPYISKGKFYLRTKINSWCPVTLYTKLPIEKSSIYSLSFLSKFNSRSPSLYFRELSLVMTQFPPKFLCSRASSFIVPYQRASSYVASASYPTLSPWPHPQSLPPHLQLRLSSSSAPLGPAPTQITETPTPERI